MMSGSSFQVKEFSLDAPKKDEFPSFGDSGGFEANLGKKTKA